MTQVAAIENSIENIEERINAFIDRGENRFDPVRFRYIEAMLRRSKHSIALRSEKTIQRLNNTLDDYQSRYANAEQQATQTCAGIEQHNKESAMQAQSLLADKQFSALNRLNKKLQRQKPQQTQPLQLLTASLLHETASDEQTASNTLDQALKQQEAKAIASLTQDSAHKNRSGELKSIALFRESWAKLNTDKLTDQAIKSRPENAGPLNPERLASSSLSQLKELSPRYLNRFIGYVDTLLWLQQADEKRVKAAKKEANKPKKT